MKRSISIAAVALLAGLLLFHARAIDQFKSSAMRFVAAEAISFVVIPDLQDFFNHGVKPIREVINALGSEGTASNFIPLLLPSPKLQDDQLPAQCRTIGSAEDLKKNGIISNSGFSVARLDSGFKLAAKLIADGSGLVFLSDILFPTYARIGYRSQFDIHKKPESTAEDSSGSRESGSSDKADVYKFSFDVKGSGVEFCPDPDWKAKDARTHPFFVEGTSEHIYVPVRFSDSILNSEALPPKVSITCEVSKNSEPPKPCGCHLIELGISSAEISSDRQADCQKADAFGKRKNDLSQWIETLRRGDTVSIGDQYVAVIDGFHVVEGFLSGRRKPAAFRVLRPTVSIVSDDSLVSQFERIVREGKEYPTTIFAGARPDWIVDVAGINGLPMYLLTPIGIHLSDNKIYLNALSNLEPQDMAIVQTMATVGKSPNNQRGWSDWRKALGGKISDSSLKLYAEFLRSYFPNVDTQLAKDSPLAQVAIDVMEEGAGAVVVSVSEFYSPDDTARLAIAVPDVDAENAGWLITQSRRQSILRQARSTVEKSAALAIQQGATPKDLKQAAMNLYCDSSLWRLSKLEIRAPREGDPRPKIRSKIEINEEAFNQVNWSVVGSGFQFQRILPFEDANAVLWGNAYDNGKGLVEKEVEDLKPQAEDFTDYIEEMRSNLNEEADSYMEVLDAMVPVLSKKAILLESRRSRAKERQISSLVEQLRTVTGVADALAKLATLKSAFQDADDIASLGPPEVAALCQAADRKLTQSPIAFHDRRTGTLYVVDTPELIAKLVGSSSGRDGEGKLLVGFEMPHLAELLMGNKTINEGIAKQMTLFPFAKVELSLSGRQDGTGISARLTIEKAQGK